MTSSRVLAGRERLVDASEDGSLGRLAQAYGIDLVVLFGSAVSGDDPGDLDVAVRFMPDRQGARLPELVCDLVDLTDVQAVDVLVLNRATPVARERALVGCLPLYERAPSTFALAQLAAIMERMETEPLRELELRLLAE